MTAINITAGNVSIKLNPATAAVEITDSPALAAETGALEWSETLLDGELVTYAEAEKAVKALGPEWRLATRQELLTLVDLSRHDPAIDTDKYPDTKSTYYWTSSECAWDSDARWVVDFNYGYVYYYPQDLPACVRAVRASQ